MSIGWMLPEVADYPADVFAWQPTAEAFILLSPVAAETDNLDTSPKFYRYPELTKFYRLLQQFS